MADRKNRNENALVPKFGITMLLLTLSICCGKEKAATSINQDKPPTKAETQSTKAETQPPQCDATLWKHVYNPDRLQVVADCKEVTGTIEELDQNEDGDTHMLMQLDPGQEDLLDKRNLKKKEGNLVVEVVCANEVTDKKAREACKGYSTNVQIPKVGDHVRVTGSYVIDSHNGWAEIHPVTSISAAPSRP